MAKIEQLVLTVEHQAIHCEGCESRIQAVLGRLPGVMRVKANHKTQRVSLTLDVEKTPLDDVKQKLEFAGYPTR
ncbi:MAG: heavy-metal-associated domain-containing protein [Chloroflexi bacterium]|nr:heavy-metal-associated domain-containing protein [Chloroflexota bacterium]